MEAQSADPGTDPPVTTFSAESFQTDLFTGAATAQIPIVVPAGASGLAPKVVLRYNSSTVDQLKPTQQGQGSGLGWSLDIGGFILRDPRSTVSTADDKFKLVFGGVSHDLVLVDSVNNIYHTKDETFYRLQYDAAGDSWTLTSKDGTQHRFGFFLGTKMRGLAVDLKTPLTWRYYLDQIKTTSGVQIGYSYFKQTATAGITGRPYDQAVYPETITYARQGSAQIGAAREVRFLRAPRSDWTDTTSATGVSLIEKERLDSIEVRVGTGLVRKYVLGFDYSIDRDPALQWGGGATGDLTLKSVTLYGSDGLSTLPSLSFTYSEAVLASAGNGIGGAVSYGHEQVGPLYWSCLFENDEGTCTSSAPTTTQSNFGSTPLGVLLKLSLSGTIPLYRKRGQVFC